MSHETKKSRLYSFGIIISSDKGSWIQVNILSATVDDTNTSQATMSCNTEQTHTTLASPCPCLPASGHMRLCPRAHGTDLSLGRLLVDRPF